MINDEGDNVDLYIPRKCSATNRLIGSKDFASVQINVGHLDENGVYTGQATTFALCGFLRTMVSHRMCIITPCRVAGRWRAVRGRAGRRARGENIAGLGRRLHGEQGEACASPVGRRGAFTGISVARRPLRAPSRAWCCEPPLCPGGEAAGGDGLAGVPATVVGGRIRPLGVRRSASCP